MKKKMILSILIFITAVTYFLFKKNENQKVVNNSEAKVAITTNVAPKLSGGIKSSTPESQIMKTIKERKPIVTAKSISSYLKEAFPDVKWEILTSSQKSKVMIGLQNPIANFGLHPEKESQLLKGLLSSLEIPEEQIIALESDKNLDDEFSENEKIQSKIFTQNYHGYSVIGSSLSFEYRKSDHALLLINAQLSDIGSPSLDVLFSKNDTEKKLFTKFTQAQIIINDKPVLLPKEGESAELVWTAYVKDSKGENHLHFVSAISGETLKINNLNVY